MASAPNPYHSAGHRQHGSLQILPNDFGVRGFPLSDIIPTQMDLPIDLIKTATLPHDHPHNPDKELKTKTPLTLANYPIIITDLMLPP